jgi:diadenosine tetraphosphate (Ap4A) HIT family hydrolase
VTSADDWKHDRIGSAERGENPTVLMQLPSGYVVIGDAQFLPGYCVLLRSPQVGDLNQLSSEDRAIFQRDMALVGDAISMVCGSNGLRRINYEILGNLDEFLHAHIWPRYEWEPEDRRTTSVWLYPKEMWSAKEHQLSAEHDELRKRLTKALQELAAGLH